MIKDSQIAPLLRQKLNSATSICYDEGTHKLEIIFPETPTQAELYKLKVVLFYREEINCDVQEVMQVVGNKVTISMANYEIFSKIYDYLKSSSVPANVISARVRKDSLEFSYTVNGPRAFLVFDALNPIQQIVNPNSSNPLDSVSVVGSLGQYNMTVHL